MFNRILVANRGEIAVRIIRACKELGIKTVAIHSEADENALHVRFADRSVCVGPPPSIRSYLNVPHIISAAEITDCDAIHPGYGFLAENAEFAEMCESSRIRFIGPTPDNIRMMGNKARARRAMDELGIPVIQGSEEIVGHVDELADQAKKIGYPVVLKASSGGGGHGMRVVRNPEDFRNLFKIVSAEAAASFKDSLIYLEKYIENPKHVEIQILADSQGNLVHLGERDCSIQRRHQKLVEEAPCIDLGEDLRKEMGECALAIARDIQYENVGTVEFLFQDGKYYFMEMNTRIQVEHPVTEMVTGIDLVKEQIKITAGQPLSFSQESVRFQGHSIECRVNSEEPDNFQPVSGYITDLHIPGGPGIRVDTALLANSKIPPYYDSLIAKVIVHGMDREDAIVKMKRALNEFHIDGTKTIIPFHLRLLDHPDFIAGHYSTHFVDDMIGGLTD